MSGSDPAEVSASTDEEVQETATDHLGMRRAKLDRLRAQGIEPFPHDFDGAQSIGALRSSYEGRLDAGEEGQERVRIAGRLAARRGSGKAAFLDVVDRSGRLQVHARIDQGRQSHVAADAACTIEIGQFRHDLEISRRRL